MLDHLIVMISLLGAGQVGMATIFGSSKWDKWNPHSRLACTHREIDDRKDLVIAHNTLPCGTRLWIFNPRTGRSVIAHVADRGPRYGDADLSIPTARAIGHNGRETVLLVPVWRPPPRAGEAAPVARGPAPIEEGWDVTPSGPGELAPARVEPSATIEMVGALPVEEGWHGSGRDEDAATPTLPIGGLPLPRPPAIDAPPTELPEPGGGHHEGIPNS